MTQIRNVFQALTKENPSPALRETILLRLAMEEALLLKRKRSLALFGLLSSFVVLSVLGIQYGALFFQSDFWALLSLVFSDLSVVANSFQDFGYSLLETLPVVPLLALFLPLTFLFWFSSLFFSSKKTYHPYAQVPVH